MTTKLEVATDEAFANVVETVSATVATGDVEYVVSYYTSEDAEVKYQKYKAQEEYR